MSASLLRRAPSHQPPPPSASKSRSRHSCSHDDGVPALQLNTAHCRVGDVVEVQVAQRHAPPPPPPSALSHTHPAASLTSPLRQRVPQRLQRSRLDAEEEPLIDSLSFTEATAATTPLLAKDDQFPSRQPPHHHDHLRRDNVNNSAISGRDVQEGEVSTASSVIFDGQDEDSSEDDNIAADEGSPLPHPYNNSRSGRMVYQAPNESSADESPMFYEAENQNEFNSSRTVHDHHHAEQQQQQQQQHKLRPFDHTVAPRETTAHVAAHRPLHLDSGAEHTSRKLVYSASAMLTSPREMVSHAHFNDQEGRMLGGPLLQGSGEESASSPLLHRPHKHAHATPGHGDDDSAPFHPARMAPLVPPTSAQEENKAGENDAPGKEKAEGEDVLPDVAQRHDSLPRAAHRSTQLPPPPTPHADFDKEDAEMESAMKEMAARLRSHDRSGLPARDAAGELSSGEVMSNGNSPPMHPPQLPQTQLSSSPLSSPAPALVSKRRDEMRDALNRSAGSNFSSDEPHVVHQRRCRGVSADLVSTEDTIEEEEVVAAESDDDLVQSVRDDLPAPPRHPNFASPHVEREYGGFEGHDDNNDDDRFEEGGYTFFSSQLPPPVDRRAKIQELAKILREGEALLASSEERENDAADEAQRSSNSDPAVAGVPFVHNAGESPVRLPRRTAPLTSPPAAPVAPSRDASLSFSEGVRHTSAMTTFTSLHATPHHVFSPPTINEYSGGPRADAALFTGGTHSPISHPPAAADDDNRGGQPSDKVAAEQQLDLSTSASLSTSTARRQRPPPRMLCPPTPSPSKPRDDPDEDPGLGDDEDKEGGVASVTTVEEEGTSIAHCETFVNVFHCEAPPVITAFSARAPATMSRLVSPFSADHPNASSAISTTPSASPSCGPSLQPFSRPDAAVGPLGDSTASVLTACSEDAAERPEEDHLLSVLYGPTDGSVCAAEENAPIPLSPTCPQTPPATQQAASSSFRDATAAPTSLPAVFYRTDKESRRTMMNEADVATAPMQDVLAAPQRTSASHGAFSSSSSAAKAVAMGGTALICGDSVVRRSLARRTSPEGEYVDSTSQSPHRPSAQHEQQQQEQQQGKGRCGSAAHEGLLPPASWSTVDSVEETASDLPASPLPTADNANAPAFFSCSEEGGGNSQRRASHSPGSCGSSPLPVPPLHAVYGPAAADAATKDDVDDDEEDEEDDNDEAHLLYDRTADVPRGADGNVQGRPTWQSGTYDGELFDDDDDDDDSEEEALTPVAEMLQRAEGKTAVLRLELTAATARATAAEEALLARESECAELHTLVDHLQAELTHLRESARQRAAVQETRVSAAVQAEWTVQAPAPDERSSTALCATSSMGGVEALTDEWRRRHDGVAQELATVKGAMAEQLAVLDRLGLTAPFSEAAIAAAERRLRHVRVANAPAKVSGGRKAISAADTEESTTKKGSVLSLLTQRKHQQQQQQQPQQLQSVKGRSSPRRSVEAAASRAESAHGAAEEKENVFVS